MSWGAVGAIGGAAISAMGNKKKGPSLAENMNTMYGTWGTAQSSLLAQQYQNTGGPQYYPGQTLADWSPQTQAAVAALYNRGAAGNPALTAAMDRNAATSRGDYLYSNPSLGALQQFDPSSLVGPDPLSLVGADPLALLGGDPSRAGMNAFAGGGVVGANPAQNYFMRATAGDFVGKNPYLEAMFGAASGDITRAFRNSVTPGLASQFAAAGRTGSGASQGAFSDASNNLLTKLGDIGANIYGTAYENERNRQQGAAGSLAQINQFERAQQLAALNDISDSFYTGQGQALQAADMGARTRLAAADQGARTRLAASGQRLSALTQASDIYGRERQLQQAANALAPSLAAQDWIGIQNMLNAGQMIDSRQQSVIDDARARYDFEQNRPFNFAQDFTSLIAGNPGASAFARNPAVPPQQNTLISGLGGALAGGRLAEMLGAGGNPSDLLSKSIFGNAGASYTPSDESQYADFWG